MRRAVGLRGKPRQMNQSHRLDTPSDWPPRWVVDAWEHGVIFPASCARVGHIYLARDGQCDSRCVFCRMTAREYERARFDRENAGQTPPLLYGHRAEDVLRCAACGGTLWSQDDAAATLDGRYYHARCHQELSDAARRLSGRRKQAEHIAAQIAACAAVGHVYGVTGSCLFCGELSPILGSRPSFSNRGKQANK